MTTGKNSTLFLLFFKKGGNRERGTRGLHHGKEAYVGRRKRKREHEVARSYDDEANVVCYTAFHATLRLAMLDFVGEGVRRL